eukprot:5306510-Alexandrium_andersonii.AAC.1
MLQARGRTSLHLWRFPSPSVAVKQPWLSSSRRVRTKQGRIPRVGQHPRWQQHWNGEQRMRSNECELNRD